MTEEKQKWSDLLKVRRYDPSVKPPDINPIFTIQGKIVGMLQSYIVFSGLPKASKSTFLAAVAASSITDSSIWQMRMSTPKERRRIGYFDTEMSAFDFYRQMDKIKYLAGSELPPYFDAYSMREDMPSKIKMMVEQYLIDNPDCAVCFIDGFLDLCLNYNDERETRLLTNWFKRITKQYNCLLIGVIHLSKGVGETLGHLGSNTDRWAQSTMIVEKVKETNQFVLKPKYLRSSDDFEPIAIMNYSGNWTQVPYIPVIPNVKAKK